MTTYELDGARAVWPKLPLLRSLCEIEFALDAASTQLADALTRERQAEDGGARGRLPSYSQGLQDLPVQEKSKPTARPTMRVGGSSSARPSHELDGELSEFSATKLAMRATTSSNSMERGSIPATSSHASLASLGLSR